MGEEGRASEGGVVLARLLVLNCHRFLYFCQLKCIFLGRGGGRTVIVIFCDHDNCHSF